MSDTGVEKPVTKQGKTIPKKKWSNNNKKVDENNLLVCHFGDEWGNDPSLNDYKLYKRGKS